MWFTADGFSCSKDTWPTDGLAFEGLAAAQRQPTWLFLRPGGHGGHGAHSLLRPTDGEVVPRLRPQGSDHLSPVSIVHLPKLPVQSAVRLQTLCGEQASTVRAADRRSWGWPWAPCSPGARHTVHLRCGRGAGGSLAPLGVLSFL